MALSQTELHRLHYLAKSDQMEAKIHGLCEICNHHTEDLGELVATINESEGDVLLTGSQRELCGVALKLLIACGLLHNYLEETN